MGGFGDISLANKFGIILGFLIVLTFGAGFTKVWINRRRLVKATREAELEAAKGHDGEKYNTKKFTEGDLFGVRAIEHGYFGGVAQTSRPGSPTGEGPMSPKSIASTMVQPLPPAKVYPKPISPIRAMSPSRRIGGARSPRLASPRLKPSPLRLHSQISDVEYGNDDPSNQGHELTPISATRPDFQSSARSVSSVESRDEWVSPLDLHFDRPVTPSSPLSNRTNSYMPRLQFPEDDAKNPVFIVGQSENSDAMKSQAASIHSTLTKDTMRSSAFSASTFNSSGQPYSQKVQSPVFSLFPGNVSSRLPSARFSEETRPPRLSSTHRADVDAFSAQDGDSQHSYPSPPESGDEGNKGHPVLRDSAVSVNRVSVYNPQRHRSQSPHGSEVQMHRGSVHSGKFTSRSRSQSAESSKQSNHKRSASSGSTISRTHNSIRGGGHARKASRESRRSRDRDAMHYDPKENRRNRSGSVQGRAVDFDHPRQNPFIDAHAIPDGSIADDINTVLADRVSNMKATGRHPRFATDESQHNTGSFADNYYHHQREGVHVAQRAQSISGQARGDRRGKTTKIVEVSSPPRGRQPSTANFF